MDINPIPIHVLWILGGVFLFVFVYGIVVWVQYRDDKLMKRLQKQDDALDGILLHTRVSDFNGTMSIEGDAEEIDLTHEPGGQQTMSELMEQMEGL